MPSPYASITLPYVVLQPPRVVIFCLLQVHDGGEKPVSGKWTKFTLDLLPPKKILQVPVGEREAI